MRQSYWQSQSLFLQWHLVLPIKEGRYIGYIRSIRFPRPTVAAFTTYASLRLSMIGYQINNGNATMAVPLYENLVAGESHDWEMVMSGP